MNLHKVGKREMVVKYGQVLVILSEAEVSMEAWSE